MGVPIPQAELNSLSAACQKLYELDQNRAQHGTDYSLNLQASKRGFDQTDVANAPLFSSVNEALLRRGTYHLFIQLLDNYTSATGTAEVVTAEEKREESEFLDAVIASPCMQYVHSILMHKNLAPQSVQEFKKMLHQMWFELYTRDVRNDTSGFEHVFCGETSTSKGEVTGFHNWIRFYLEEKKGKLNYYGHINPKPRKGQKSPPTEPSDAVISVQFGWGGEVKAVSSMFVGCSPEFEMALYTLCFVAGTEENLVQIGPFDLKIRAYRIRSKYGDKVGSTFPELLAKGSGGHSTLQVENGGGQMGFVAASPPEKPAWGQTLPAASPQGPRKNRNSPRPHASGAQEDDSVKQGCGSILKLLLDGLISYLKKK
eukprot:jgi/Botrbrau1/318/Bobra.0022s0280.1